MTTKSVFGGVVSEDYAREMGCDKFSAHQEIVDLNNGYSLSIIRGRWTFGFWEVAVINNTTGELDYDTDLTYDVVRFANPSEVEEFIRRGQRMDANGTLEED